MRAVRDFTDSIESIDEVDPGTRIKTIDSVTQPIRRWYVIYTKPRAEDVAREQLEMKQIPVFLPKIPHVTFRKGRLKERIEPLFPSYLFARFAIPDEYYGVKWAKGVKRIVGNGDTPIPLDDSIVIFLKEKANEKGLVQPESNLKDGDQVRVRQGPLQGLLGIVQGVVGAKGRVRILMDILRAGAKVELPYSAVERLGGSEHFHAI
jgi:transcriptional antiterminator RfaH